MAPYLYNLYLWFVKVSPEYLYSNEIGVDIFCRTNLPHLVEATPTFSDDYTCNVGDQYLLGLFNIFFITYMYLYKYYHIINEWGIHIKMEWTIGGMY